MAKKYLEIAVTPSVVEAQKRSFGRAARLESGLDRDALGPEETEFIAARDSFYMATVSETGWPYIQHRGGRPGFLRVVDPHTLAFADYRGNRQLLSTGNVAANDRVSLFLMDYPRRERLKILGHARVTDATSKLPGATCRTGGATLRRAAVFHRCGLVRLELSEIHHPALQRG